MKKIFVSLILILSLCSCGTKQAPVENQGSGNLGSTENPSHTYAEEWTYDDHYHWHMCTVEGHNDHTEFEEHLFHVAEKVLPTFESIGYTRYKCTSCPYEYIGSRESLLEHNYSSEWSYNSTQHWHACIDVGYEDLTKDSDFHSFVITDSRDATVEEEGYVVHSCKTCGYSYTTSIPKLDPPVEEPETPETSDIFDDSKASVVYSSFEVEGSYSLEILNSDYSPVYTCNVPYGSPMRTIEDSFKQVPFYSEDRYYKDGNHPGGVYRFDLYKFPINDTYCVIGVRGSTDETHSWNLKYVSFIEFTNGLKVDLEYSYLSFNGNYSNCIDYQCLNGDQLTGGTNTTIHTDFGPCTSFQVIIDGWRG